MDNVKREGVETFDNSRGLANLAFKGAAASVLVKGSGARNAALAMAPKAAWPTIASKSSPSFDAGLDPIPF